MGTQIADLYAKIRADTSELDKGLSHAQGAMGQAADAMGGALDSVSARAVALGVTLGNIATAGLSQLTQAVTGLASGMVSGNAEFERYQTQFTVLLKSADAAKQRLAELAEFGKVTPFELPEVVQADKILQAFGLHAENVAQRFGMAGDEIRTVAGDVAAGTGASFTEISTYLGKFASGATGEAIARMQELGITTRDELKQMGLEFSKSGELISPLDKSMTVLLQAMKTKFGGMMDAQSQTFEGMMSNLKDWFGQAQRLAGEPLFKALKDQLQSLLDLLNSPAMTQGIQQLAAGIGEGVSRAIEAFKGAIQGFKSAGLGGAATGILSALGLDDKAASMVGGVINQIVSVVQTGMAKVQAAFEAAQPYLAVLGDALMSAVPVVATLADLLGKALAGALNALGTAVQFVMEHWQPFAAALAVVAGLLAGAGIAAAVAGIGAALSALGAAVGVAVAAIGALLTPIGLLIAGVALLAVAWANNWGDIQGIAFRVVATVQALIAALGGSMSAIGEGLRVALTEGPAAGYAAFQKSMQGVDATYQQAIAAVPQRGEEMRQGFAASWDSTIATVKDKLGGMLSTQDSGLAAMVANAQQRAAEIRLALAGAQGASLATISNSFAPGQITAGMEADFVKAEATGRSLTPKAKQAAAAVVAPIKAFNTGVVSGLGGGGGGAGSKAAKTVEEQILEAANVIRNVTETVAKLKEFLSGGELSKLKSPEGADQIIEVAVWVTDLGKRMAEEFRAAAGGFKEEGNKAAAALADAIGSATSAIGNVAGMLVKLGDLMKHDKWPDMQANMGRMQEIAQQLLQFGLSLAQTLVPAAQGMSEDAAKSAQYMAQAIQAAAQATSAVADLLPKLWAFTQLPEFDEIMAARKNLQSVAKKLIAWGKDLAKSFISAAKGVSEGAAKASQNLATAITSATSSVSAVIDLLPKLLAFRGDPGLMAVLDNPAERAAVMQVAKQLIKFGAELGKQFAQAGKGLKDKAVVEAKRLADEIQATSQGLTSTMDALKLLLAVTGQGDTMALLGDREAQGALVNIARLLANMARIIGDQWAAVGRDLTGVVVQAAQRLTEGIKATADGIKTALDAVLLLTSQASTIQRIVSEGDRYLAWLIALAGWLAHVAATLTNEWGRVASLVSGVAVASAQRLTEGVKAASEGLSATYAAVVALAGQGPTISRLAALGSTLIPYLVALTTWLAHVAAYLANEWGHVASLLNQTATGQGAALTTAVQSARDGILAVSEAILKLCQLGPTISRLAALGPDMTGHLIALTGWLAHLAAFLSNEWNHVASLLDQTTTTQGAALTAAIRTVADGLAAMTEALDTLLLYRRRIDNLARQGQPLIDYLRALNGWLGRLAVLLANDWDWLAGQLDVTTTQAGQALADAVGVVADGIGSVLDAVDTLLLYRRRIDNLARQGQPLIDYLRALNGWLAGLAIIISTTWGRLADLYDTSLTEQGQALANAISTVAGGISAAYDAARALLDIEQRGLPSVSLDLVGPLVQFGSALVTQAELALRAWQTDSAAQRAMTDLATGLDAFTAILGNVTDAAQMFFSKARLLSAALGTDGLPLTDLRTFVQNSVRLASALIDDIQSLVSEIDGVVLDSLSDLETALGSLTGALGSVIDAITLYFDTLYGGGVWARWIDEALYSETIQRFLFAWVERLINFGEALRAAAVAAVDVLDEETLAAYRAASDNLANLGDVLGNLNDAVSGVLDLVRLYFDTLYGDDKWARWMEEALYSPTIQRFIKAWLKRLIDFGEELRIAANEAIGTINRDGIESLSNLGDSLSALSGVTGSVLDIFRAYLSAIEDEIDFSSAEVQAKVKAMVGVLVAFGLTLRAEGLRVLNEAEVATLAAIPVMASLGTALSDLSNVTGSVLDIFRAYMATVEDKIRFTDADVQANVKGMVGVLVAFGLALRQAALDVLTAHDIVTLEAIPALEQLGKAVGDLSGMLGSVFDILRLFMPGDDAVDYGAEAQQRVNDALLGLIGFAVWLADRTSSTLAFYQAETLVINKGLEIVRDAVGSTADMLGSVFDILRLFAVGDDATDYSEAAQQRVEDALIELVSFAAWLANRVNATLDYYQAETIVINAGLETVSKTLGETVSIVTDTLSLSKLSKDLAAYKPMVGHAAIETALGRIIEDAKYVAKLFADKAKDSGLTTELQKAAETLSAVFGDASSAINDTLDMVAKLLDPETVIPSKEQISGKVSAILGVVDVAVTAFSARASAAAASGMDLAGLSTYASAVKGVFEAIAEVANAVNSYSNINVGRQFLGVESVGFGNIRGALQMIWDLFEDAAQHQDLVQSVTSTLTTALDGLTMLATNKGADAGNAWLRGFQGALGGLSVPQLATAPAGTGTGTGGQVTVNYITNNTKNVSVSVNNSTAEAARGSTTGIYSLVMY